MQFVIMHPSSSRQKGAQTMTDFTISRNTFLDALVLDADGKTDIIQVKLALEKAVENKEETNA